MMISRLSPVGVNLAESLNEGQQSYHKTIVTRPECETPRLSLTLLLHQYQDY